MLDRNDKIILITFLVLGILVRFLLISDQSLWMDEGATYYYTKYSLEDYYSLHEPNSPFFYIIEGGFLGIFGHSEFALRFISAIAGVGTILVSYLLVQKVFKNRVLALIVALLILVSPVCIKYSLTARGFELVSFLFVCQLYVLAFAMIDRKRIYWFIFSILATLSLAMQFTSILATFTIYLFVFIMILWNRLDGEAEWKQSMKFMLLSGVAFVVLSIPMWYFAYDSLFVTYNWIPLVTSKGVDYFVDVMEQFYYDGWLMLILIPLTVIGAFFCFKKDRKMFFVTVWIILFPLILTTIASLYIREFPRYIYWSVCAYCILIGIAITEILKLRFNGKQIGVVVTVMLVVVIAALSPSAYQSSLTNPDYRGACNIINENADSDDIILYGPDWENLIGATVSFYIYPNEKNVEMDGCHNAKQVIDLSKNPKYDTIYIVMEKWNTYVIKKVIKSDTCELLFDHNGIVLYQIKGQIS